MDIHQMTIEEIFEVIERKVSENATLFEGFKSTYNLNMTDLEQGEYGILFNDNKVHIQNKHYENADCTLSMKTKQFKKLLTGELNTTAAFMTGKLKVKGNIGLALKLESALKKLEFN